MDQRLSDGRRGLVEQHVHLVEQTIREPLARVPEWADAEHLRSVAYEALARAALAFDPSRGPFPAYARTRIAGAVIDEMRALAPRTRREHAEGADTGARPQFVSLDALLAPEGAAERGSVALSTPPVEPVAVERRTAIRRALAIFPHRERQVLVAHYVEGRPERDLARALGVSEEQVRRLKQRAVRRLRLALLARRDAGRGRSEKQAGSNASEHPSPLTPREHDVLAWAARGASARETATRLGRAEQTIISHRKRLLAKLGAKNMVHAVAIAFRHEWLT